MSRSPPCRYVATIAVYLGLWATAAGLTTSSRTTEAARCAECYNSTAGEQHCYTLNLGPADWTTAYEFCQSIDGVLAPVCSPRDEARVAELLGGCGYQGQVWVGGTLEDPPTLEDNPAPSWRWVPGFVPSLVNTPPVPDQCPVPDLAGILARALPYQGCYQDDTTQRDLPYNSGLNSDDVTPQTCISACATAGYAYSGVQSNIDATQAFCYCGSSYGTYGSMPTCAYDCPGDSNVQCGGYMINAIYKTHVVAQLAHWGYGRPENLAAETCGAVDGYWQFLNDVPCDSSNTYICELPSANCTVADTSRYLNSSVGTCLYRSDVMDTWYRARESCVLYGGDLLRMTNASLQNDLGELCLKTSCDRNDMIYIGFYRETYVWKRAYSEVEMPFTRYASGQPSSGGSCISLGVADNYAWKTQNEADTNAFICYTGPDQQTPPTTSTTTSATPATSATTSAATGLPSSSTSPSSTGSTPILPSSSASTTALLPPSTPAPSTQKSAGEIALYVVAAVLIVAIIVLIILLLCYRKKNSHPVGPLPDKQDARVDATMPECGPIGMVDEGFGSYNEFIWGSEVNLLGQDIEYVDVPAKRAQGVPQLTSSSQVGNATYTPRPTSTTSGTLKPVTPDMFTPRTPRTSTHEISMPNQTTPRS